MTDRKSRLTGLHSRRSILKGSLATTAGLGALSLSGVAPLHFVRGAFAEEKAIGNYPSGTSGPTIKFGFNVPQTGAYADEGKDELKAQALAVKHLNGEGDGGLLSTMKPGHLKGNGVLGKKVEFVTGDTATGPDAARANAKQMIEKDGVIMINGGSSSSVAIAVQSLCQEAGIIFMCGLTHSNDTTGKDRRRYGFRHFFNAYMSGQALGPILGEAYGKERVAYHLTSDYSWGWTQQKSIADATERLGWKTAANVLTKVGAPDFSQYITPVLNSGADVLILNHYGFDMVHSLTQSVQFGLRDKMVNGKQFEIVTPLISELMAQGAGDAVKGIYGTSNWNWQLPDEATKVLTKSFGAEFGSPPSQAAQTCYVQTLLYANAVEMAGTFYPPEVIKTLEGLNYDGMGNGPTEYRAADHQSFKDVLVVKGKENPSNQFDVLDIVKVAPRSTVEYDPNIPDFNPDGKAELGPYEPA